MKAAARARTQSGKPAKRSSNWGGARPGAGRKPGPNPKTPHRARSAELVAGRLQVTLRSALVPLRSPGVLPVVRQAIAAADQRAPYRFRIVEHSVQRDHVDLVVEAADTDALSSGMRSVSIRIARAVNDQLGRSGPLWSDRWHTRVLKPARARS